MEGIPTVNHDLRSSSVLLGFRAETDDEETLHRTFHLDNSENAYATSGSFCRLLRDELSGKVGEP